jgi:hypothetical protein
MLSQAKCLTVLWRRRLAGVFAMFADQKKIAGETPALRKPPFLPESDDLHFSNQI